MDYMIARLFTRIFSFKKESIAERYFVAFVGLAALVAVTASLAIGLNQSVWFDEGYSIMVAEQPMSEVISLTAVDAHPPLYYLLLKGWMALFGTSELALRSSSAIAGGLSVVVIGFLLRDLFSKRIALMALPVVAAAPFLLRYNFEIRMYAFVMLIGLAATWVMLRAWRTRQAKWWIIYGLLVAIGMYTLYMSVVFWLAHVVWLTIMAYQTKRSIVKQPYWLAYIGAVIAFLPWVPTVFAQLSHSALPPYMSTVTLYELSNVLGLLMAYSPGWQIGPWLSLILLVFLATYAIVFSKVWSRLEKPQRQGLLLLALCFIIGIIFYALISLPPNPPRFLERYVVHIAVFWYGLLGVVIAYGWQLRPKIAVSLLTATTIVMLGWGAISVAHIGNYNFQRVQYLQAKTIRHTLGCDDTTFVTAGPFGYIDMKYEFQGCNLQYYYPLDVTLTGGFAPVDKSADRIKNTLAITSTRLVYVYFDDSDVKLSPDARFHEVERRSFDKTRVIIYER
jgi:uncharacterized membrane protein